MSDFLDGVLNGLGMIGGLLFPAGCSSYDEPIPSYCYDDAKLKEDDSAFNKCRDLVCDPADVDDGWNTSCGFHNFNGFCFASCGEDPDTTYIPYYSDLYHKLCVPEERSVRSQFTPPGLYPMSPEPYGEAPWCDSTGDVPESLPPFSANDGERFVRYLMEELNWQIRVGNGVTAANDDEGLLTDPAESASRLAAIGALPAMGIESEQAGCGLLCAMIDSFNRLVGYPHLLELIRNDEGDVFSFAADYNQLPLYFYSLSYDCPNGVCSESVDMQFDVDAMLKYAMCMHGPNVSQDDVNEYMAQKVTEGLMLLIKTPPDDGKVDTVLDQLGHDELVELFWESNEVYYDSPSLRRGYGIEDFTGGMGFVNSNDHEGHTRSFASEAAFYLREPLLFRQYADEDAAVGDYFLWHKLTLLSERLFCEGVETPPQW